MKRSRYILLLLLCACISGLAQRKQIDSLQNALSRSAADTNKVKILIKLSGKMRTMGIYDSSLQYAAGAKELAEKLNYKSGLGKAYNNIGAVYADQDNYPEAIKNFKASLWVKKEQHNTSGMADCYNNIGVIYYNQGNYTEALKNYLTALKLQEEIGDKAGIAFSYNNLGSLHARQGNNKEALRNHLASLKIKEEIDDKWGIAWSYNNIGNVYFNLYQKEKNRDSAAAILEKCIKNHTISLQKQIEIDNKQGISASYNNLANAFFCKEDYNEALKKYFASLKIVTEIGDKGGIESSYINLCATYLRLKNYKEAERYGTTAVNLAREIGDIDGVKEGQQNMSLIYSATGRDMEALASYKAYVAAKDSLVNEENTKSAVRLEMNYEFNKKEEAAKLEQEKKDAIAKAESKKQQIVLMLISSMLVLVLIFAAFVYRSFLQKKKANIEINRQKEVIEEKQREIIDSIHYAKRIQSALLPNEKYISKFIK